MRPFVPVAAALSLGVLVGCASMTPTTEREESYAIYHVTPTDTITTRDLSDAIVTGLQNHMSEVRVDNRIPPSPLPDEPARFRLVDPFQGSNLGALAAASGGAFRVPSCDQAVMTVNADDRSMNQYGENTTFFLCLQPYKAGYHIDIYVAFSKKSGAVTPALLGATLARNVLGDSSQFLPRTIEGVVDEVKKTGAEVTLVEAYP